MTVHTMALGIMVASGACTPRASSEAVEPRPDAETVAHQVRAWTEACAARIEAARRAVLPTVPAFAQMSVTLELQVWNPFLRVEVRTASGYYQGRVAHGAHPCIDFESDAPAHRDHPWRDGHSSKPGPDLDRIRRLGDDEARLQANGVAAETLAPFRAAFEEAFESCLRTAQSVPRGDVPSTMSCLDRRDSCPEGYVETADGGCGVSPAE